LRIERGNTRRPSLQSLAALPATRSHIAAYPLTVIVSRMAGLRHPPSDRHRPLLAGQRPSPPTGLALPKPRSVRPFLERHPPQYQDIGRCSRVWYGRGATVQPSDSLSVGKSVWPSSAVAYGYHSLKGPIPTEEPRNPQSGHIDGLRGEVMRGRGLEKR